MLHHIDLSFFYHIFGLIVVETISIDVVFTEVCLKISTLYRGQIGFLFCMFDQSQVNQLFTYISFSFLVDTYCMLEFKASCIVFDELVNRLQLIIRTKQRLARHSQKHLEPGLS